MASAGQRIARYLGMLLIIILAFAVGHWTAPEPTVSVAWSETAPWIEVYRHGELSSEWQPADGEVYDVLRKLLEDDPALYEGPGSRGRGPRLLAMNR